MRQTSPLRVVELSGVQSFFAFADEWRRLHEVAPDATPFQSWEWLSTWWKHLGRGRPLAIVAYEDDTPLCAMALTESSYRHTPLKLLQWMGAPQSDYNDFVGERRREECARAFMRFLTEKRGGRVCDLSDVRAETAALLASSLDLQACDAQPCALLPLPETQEELNRALSGNLRATIKKRMRQLAADFEMVQFSTVESAQDLPQGMDDLFRLHTARLRARGEKGAFANESVRAFHREVAAKSLELGKLRLHRLTVNGECRSALYCFRHADTVYYYLGGFDPAFGRYSPGVLILNFAIRSALDEGARNFDFMRGEEDYKARWSAVFRDNHRLVFGGRVWTSRFAVAGRRFERRLARLLRTARDHSLRSAALRRDHSSKMPSSA